jgi:hypothetical protein
MNSDEILKYFTQKQFFPSLAKWSFELNDLYNQFPMLKSMLVENIDLKEKPNMSYEALQKKLLTKLGIALSIQTIEVAGEKKDQQVITYTQANVDFIGLPMSIINIAKAAIRDKSIVTAEKLTQLSDLYFYNFHRIHRERGYGSEVMIPDAYFHWDWAASIANLCTSLMPVFERLIKKELLVFPELDKPLKECMTVTNSFLNFMQKQGPQVRTEEIILDENDEFVGKLIKNADANYPSGGLLVAPGSHVICHPFGGDRLLETSDKKIMALKLDDPQKFWTIAKVHVKPGEQMIPNVPVITISCMMIRADQNTFTKLFYDVYRQLGRVRKTAMYLKELIEEEIRSGGGIAGGEAESESGGYKPVTNRFDKLEMPTEEIDQASASMNMDKKEVSSSVKKIMNARSTAAG